MFLVFLYIAIYFVLLTGAEEFPAMGMYAGTGFVSLMIVIVYLHLVRNLPDYFFGNGFFPFFLRVSFVVIPMGLLLLSLDGMGLIMKHKFHDLSEDFGAALFFYLSIMMLREPARFARVGWPQSTFEKLIFNNRHCDGFIGKIISLVAVYVFFLIAAFLL